MELGHAAELFLWVVVALGGAWIFGTAFGRMRLSRAIDATPTSKVRSMPIGKVELKGRGQALGQPIKTPFSAAPCLWYRFTVEVEKPETDSQGRVSMRWSTVDSGESSAPFQLDDGTGCVMVVPEGAEIDAPETYCNTEGAMVAGRIRRTEWSLDIGSALYALGVLRAGREGETPYLGQGRSGEPFLISFRSEAELLKGIWWGVLGRMLLGASACIGAIAAAGHQFLGW